MSSRARWRNLALAAILGLIALLAFVLAEFLQPPREGQGAVRGAVPGPVIACRLTAGWEGSVGLPGFSPLV
ncbi:MAG: hypothetical protein QME94_06940 [Anaerolineae bacterium]|nr:hypothetical protein [Anaerolineae bacterium]